MTANINKKLPIASSLLVIIATAVIEWFCPVGVYPGIGFVIAIMVTLYSDKRSDTFIAFAVSGIAILLPVFYLYTGKDFMTLAINHSLSLAGVTIATLFVVYEKNMRGKIEKDNEQVNSKFSDTTTGILTTQKQELENISSEIKKLNTDLERKVEDRTMMLRETLAQLERSKDELAVSLEREKELSDLKSRFVSTVSHEFRTPLSTILSSAALMGKYRTAEEQDKRDRHISRIKESVKHMNDMLEDLLSLGKLEEGLIEAKYDLFDVDRFMKDFVNEMQEIARKGQKINLLFKGSNEAVTDKRLLKNILLNLVSNAIKFSPDDAPVDIRCDNEDNYLKISVKDSGIGISKEDQQHLFERFFRARNAANIQGSGLGLHIVSKYLELLNGKISLHSELGKGCTFTISIPSTKPML